MNIKQRLMHIQKLYLVKDRLLELELSVVLLKRLLLVM